MSAWFPRVTVHSLAIVVSVLTYVLTTRAERDRRPPSIAIAWVLGLIAMPYLVLPMYIMFGRRKLPRKQSRRGPPVVRALHWAEDLIESFDLAPASDNRVQLHSDGTQSAAALFALMQSASSRLDICTYILGNDAIGRDVTRHMTDCARRGVQVRLLLDAFGARQAPRHYFKALHAAGVETAVFSPLLARKTQGPRNLRNHRKLTIADGARLWAGGRNLAAEYFSGDEHKQAWRDLSFDVQGPVAHAAAAQFEADWVAAGGRVAEAQSPWQTPARSSSSSSPSPSSSPSSSSSSSSSPSLSLSSLSSSSASPVRAQFLPSGPDQTEDTVHALLIDACFQARERILAVTPYFVPDAGLETAMRLAARRGVKIDLCIPARSNHRLADFARNRSLRALSRAGAAVHLSPYMNHAKAIVFDRSIGISGSINLDSRSLLLNYECAVVFYAHEQIDWLAAWIEALLPATRTFDPRMPNIFRDVCEGLLLTVAYQL